jgi:YD repeat-containing protein
LVRTEDRLGNATELTLNERGDVVAIKDALGNVTEQVWSADGLLLSRKDARGNTTTFQYDAFRRQTAVVPAVGGSTVTAYDGNGNVASVTDAAGATATEHDALGRLVSTTDALSGVATVAYFAAGQVRSETDVLGKRTDYDYDRCGLLRTTTGTGGPPGQVLSRTVTMTYDDAGNLYEVQDPLGRLSRYGYDDVNRRTSITDDPEGLARTTTMAYDPAGNLIDTTDARGGGRTSITTPWAAHKVTDRADNPCSAAAPRGLRRAGQRHPRSGRAEGATTHAYDAAWPACRHDRGGHHAHARRSTFDYDAVGNLISQTTGLADDPPTPGRHHHLQLHAADRRVGMTAAAGQSEATHRLRLRRRRQPGDGPRGLSPDVAYAHAMETLFAYDALDATSVSERIDENTWRTSATTYDPAGNMLSVTDVRTR